MEEIHRNQSESIESLQVDLDFVAKQKSRAEEETNEVQLALQISEAAANSLSVLNEENVERINQLEERIRSMEAESKESAAASEELRALMSRLELERKEWTEKVVALEGNLSQQREMFESTNLKVLAQLEAAEADLQEKAEEVTELKQQLQSQEGLHEQELKNLRLQSSTLQSRIQELEATIVGQKNELSASQLQKSMLMNQIQELQSSVQDEVDISNQSIKEISNVRLFRINELEVQVLELSNQVSEAQSQQSTLEKQCDVYRTEVAHLEKMIKDLRASSALEISNANSEANVSLRMLQAEITAQREQFEQKLSGQIMEVTSAKSECANLHKSIASLKDEVADLTNKEAELIRIVQEKDQLIVELQTSIARDRADLQQAEVQQAAAELSSAAEAEIARLRMRISVLESENSQLNHSLETVGIEKNKVLVEFQTAMHKQVEIERMLYVLKADSDNEAQRLGLKIDSLEMDNLELKQLTYDRNDRINQVLQALNRQQEALSSAVSELLGNVRSMTQEIEQRDEQLKSIASLKLAQERQLESQEEEVRNLQLQVDSLTNDKAQYLVKLALLSSVEEQLVDAESNLDVERERLAKIREELDCSKESSAKEINKLREELLRVETEKDQAMGQLEQMESLISDREKDVELYRQQMDGQTETYERSVNEMGQQHKVEIEAVRSSLQGEIDRLKDTNKSLQSQLQDASQTNVAVSELMRVNETISTLKRQVIDKDQQLIANSDQLKRREGECAGLRASLESVTADNESLRIDNDELRKKVAAEVKSLKEVQREYDKLKRQIEFDSIQSQSQSHLIERYMCVAFCG